jgi:hypothetical protein
MKTRSRHRIRIRQEANAVDRLGASLALFSISRMDDRRIGASTGARFFVQERSSVQASIDSAGLCKRAA